MYFVHFKIAFPPLVGKIESRVQSIATTGLLKLLLPKMKNFSPMFPFFRGLIAKLLLVLIVLFSPNNNLRSQNLLVNGDFESGGAGTGFNTNYFLAGTPGSSSPRQYNILTNPFTMNNAFFTNADDHTFGNGTGKMMVVDGSGNA